jgi:hypothetical protein
MPNGSAANRRYRERHFVNPSGLQVVTVDIPDDVERRDTHVPCFMCGEARGPCRHRWWLLEEAC